MTTEARDALAAALVAVDDEYPGALNAVSIDDGAATPAASALLAALDGWTLVPVDAVAVIVAADDWLDARGPNPSAALREAISQRRVSYRERTGRWYDPEVVRAALGGSDDE